MRFAGLWGKGRPGARGVSIAIMPEQLHQQQVSNQEGCRGKVQNHRNGKEVVQSLISTLVDCHLVHFKYLGCWCIGTVCEENDPESEPLHFADGLPHHQPRRDGLAVLLPGYY